MFKIETKRCLVINTVQLIKLDLTKSDRIKYGILKMNNP